MFCLRWYCEKHCWKLCWNANRLQLTTGFPWTTGDPNFLWQLSKPFNSVLYLYKQLCSKFPILIMDHYTSQDSTLIIFQYYVWTLHSKWILLIGLQDLTKSHTKCPLSGFRDPLMLLTVTVTDINIDGGFCLLQGYALRKERSLTIA